MNNDMEQKSGTGSASNVTDLLKRCGFRDRRTVGSVTLFMRIHIETWAEIDEHGFVTIVRNHENKRGCDKVTLPRPIRTAEDVTALVHLVSF